MAIGEVRVETKHGSDDELRTKALLEGLMAEHDLSRFTFTHDVRIDENAIPHSHPVLTMSTRFMVRSRNGALADYLHEQLHWYVSQHRRAARDADKAWRKTFGAVPRAAGGGAKTRRSTRLHLTVNWLEFEALSEVVGRDAATDVLHEKANGRIYPWVYRQVVDRYDEIGAVLNRVGLAQNFA
ncbi:MAG: hypothetical protein QOG90_2523 [Actinomycetota bacterium]